MKIHGKGRRTERKWVSSSALLPFLFLSLSSCGGCGKRDKARPDDDDRPRKHHVVDATPTPRAVWMRKLPSTTGSTGAPSEWTVVTVRADDPGDPQPLDVGITGSPIDARGFDRGRAMMLHARIGSSHPILRVTWDDKDRAHTEKVFDDDLGSMILLSEDGSVAMMESGGDPFAAGHVATLTALRLDGSQTRIALHSFRYYDGGDIARDGKTILFSGIPTTCTATKLGSCPIELWRARLDGDHAIVEPLRADAHAHYQPRFVHGSGIFGSDFIVYQTTENDSSPTCATSLNDCRHDLVRLVDGVAKPTLVRAGAFGPAPSLDGDELAFLTFEGTSCTRFPCLGATLVIADGGGAHEQIITTGEAYRFSERSFSPEGDWIEYGTGTTPHTTKLCPVSAAAKSGKGGAACKSVVTEDYFQTWLR